MENLKILFSPSESKLIETSNTEAFPSLKEFLANSPNRSLEKTLQSYIDFLQQASEGDIKKAFGTKRINPIELALCQNILHSPTIPAIQRYRGVAFKALDFIRLTREAQDFINNYVWIFSNLLGVIRADTPIPYYKLKQGEGFLDFKTQNFYKEMQCSLEEFCRDCVLLDLRAEFYQKCFIPHTHRLYIQPIFRKNNKNISHYAKYYRGIFLRYLAQNTTALLKKDYEAFFTHSVIEGIKLQNIQKRESKVSLIYEVFNPPSSNPKDL